ncbi:MAG: translation initiation factor IF-3, partial [Candidatus Brennerbacteria bacterium CG_4_9_14_3_um_filter_43_9]
MLLIDEDGTSLGVQPLFSALAKSRERGLDLVEISPNNNPPVCKIMD